MNLYALLALVSVAALIVFGVYSLGRREGMRISNEKGREHATDKVNETLDRVYDGRIGSDDFRVRNKKPWGGDKGTHS